MDILLRRFDGEPYVWKKAKFENGNIIVDDKVFLEKDIVSIRNDNRKQYVYCSECKTYFRKGSKKIEKHKEGCNDTHMCFSCRFLNERRPIHTTKKYQLLENGNYISKTKSEVSLYCRRSYRNYEIKSQEARDNCVYNRCKTAHMLDVNGFFLQKPGAFDDIITIDKLVEKGYKSAYKDHSTNCIHYALTGRNSIYAVVNELNIIAGFIVHYNGDSYHVYYSKKYDSIFERTGTSYKLWDPYEVPERTKYYIKNKIVELYD